MKLSQEQVQHIANLARLAVTPDEASRYSEQLSAILDYVEQMNRVDTTSIEPTSQVTGLANVSRSDQRVDSGIAAELVAQAPRHSDGYIDVPPILTGEEETA